MNGKIYRLTIWLVLAVLVFGQFSSARADGMSAPAAAAKTYIVDKNNIGKHGCKDTWPGTLTQPLCSIPKGLSLLHPGDTLSVRRGPYPAFEVRISGKAGSYITISGYGKEMPLVKGGVGIKLIGTAYVRIRKFEVTGASDNGDYMGGITITPSSSVNPSNNIIEWNKVHHNTASHMSGIKVADGSNNKILHNTVFSNNFVGIRLVSNSAPATGNEIGFNRVYNNTLSGGDSDGIGLNGEQVSKTYIHGNVVYGNADDGIDTWNSSHNTIVGNIVYNQNGVGDGNGIKAGGSDTGGSNLVKNNVSYNNKANGFHSNKSGGNIYYQNVAYNNGNYGFQDVERNNSSCTRETCPGTLIDNIGYNNIKGNFAAGQYTAVSHNNIWYSDSGSAKVAYEYKLYDTLLDFYAVTGNRLDNPAGGTLASMQVNPMFVDAAAAKFALLPTSPAIDRGDPSNPAKVVAKNRVDIGAYEFRQASTETRYDDMDKAFVYSAGWKNQASADSYNGSYKTTAKSGATVTLKFTGQSFSILYTTGPGNRKIKVYVDGVLKATLNEKLNSVQYKKGWDYPGTLAAGSHTLKLVFISDGVPNSIGTLDAVIVH